MALFKVAIADSTSAFRSDRWVYHVEASTAVKALEKAYKAHNKANPTGANPTKGATTVWSLKRLDNDKVVR